MSCEHAQRYKKITGTITIINKLKGSFDSFRVKLTWLSPKKAVWPMLGGCMCMQFKVSVLA